MVRASKSGQITLEVASTRVPAMLPDSVTGQNLTDVWQPDVLVHTTARSRHQEWPGSKNENTNVTFIEQLFPMMHLV